MNDRSSWLDCMSRVAEPVLVALAAKELKRRMPIRSSGDERDLYTHLEALGRTLAGIAPWLENGARSGEEGRMRERYALLARQAIDAGTEPVSPDYMNFCQGEQPVVDAAFLAHALLRAPQELIGKLEPRVRRNVIAALQATRVIRPHYNNWLLFSAMIEAALFTLGEAFDPMRVDYALRQHEQWYAGDGTYGDGPEFHWDYYNSFVIQPMLIDVLQAVGDSYPEWERLRNPILKRARRYAAVQERMISPEGTFPAIGRSLAYRCGAFQLLAQMALRRDLPDGLTPAAVRCALTAVILKVLRAPGTFDPEGWLKIGLCGEQPELGEHYISTGSLYLCMSVFLPLGLTETDPFWTDPDEPWTNKAVWSGGHVPIDKTLYL